MENRMTKHTD